MKRIAIFGCSGSGKSTLASKLNSLTGLDVVHLDKLYFSPGWVEPEHKEWEKKVINESQKEKWIIEGNYTRTLHHRLERADTIIYLDFNTITCLYRVIKRTLKYWGKVRPDLVEGCPERFDLDFFHYVATFNLVRRKKILNMIKQHPDKRIYILKNKKSVDLFLKTFED